MRKLVVVAAVVGAGFVAAPAPLRADPGKLVLFPDLASSLGAGTAAGPSPAAGYTFRPADGSLVLEAPLFDVAVEGDGTLTIRDLSPQSARIRRLNKARYRRDEPPAPDRPWSVNPPVYNERGHRAPIRDALPLVPVRTDDPTRSVLNDLLLYRLPAPPWVAVFVPKLQHRQIRDATLDLRIELARHAADRRAEAALRALPAELDDIWRDDRRSEADRRATIQALADDTDTSTAAGRQAKAIIDGFLSKTRAVR